VADQLARAWSAATELATEPILQLCGQDQLALRGVAAAACARVGRGLISVAAEDLPTSRTELSLFVRGWERDAVLGNVALLLECQQVDMQDMQRLSGIRHLIDQAQAPLMLATVDRLPSTLQAMVSVDVARPTSVEQHGLWTTNLGDLGEGFDDRQLDAVVDQFNLTEAEIRAACAQVRSEVVATSRVPAPELGATVWAAARAQAQPRMGDLAQRIDSSVTWDDLVLPDAIIQTLQEVVVHVQQRRRVNDDWGFAARSSRGLGISALFSGASGTGKTMAAEVLAGVLNLDLYRVDLSSTMSKYIGETEKNIRRIFDAAEYGGAILLFDEADALFGKRSAVKDSHDRYANIEVGYLLQRMEAYRGLAILTTNKDDALDAAFVRRIRFIVRFPYPDESQRREIWRRVFPKPMPCSGVDLAGLARLNVAGGTIHTIALGAAALAAAEDRPLGMEHLLRATRTEYIKLKRPLSELRVWAPTG
jgi:ATP-dependent 26S proteasome regulatory subunit